MTTPFKLHNIVKRYQEREVLNIDQLEIPGGKIYTILGPNGSGKTTLLRIMALLLVNDQGSLEVFGEKVNWSKNQILRLRRQMSMVTQTAFMFQGSVFYNVSYGLRKRKASGSEIKRRVDEALEMVGMSAYREADSRTLSGGERQKVAIARALILKPQILFLDEPTSNIDIASGAEIEKYIREINQIWGTTIIMVTHNLFQAKRLADEVLFLHEGKIIEKGKTAKIFDQPADERTAAFMRGETVF
ncbi:MAG: phosphate ABC transporter ATP-binding protein [Syntrophomonadaceae bacterium]|jgi:tungstate transport system ATP-binding protein|nr:phosphate ABC transporter ATP-binding protein [Syntrophomonadaceae bacterium]